LKYIKDTAYQWNKVFSDVNLNNFYTRLAIFLSRIIFLFVKIGKDVEPVHLCFHTPKPITHELRITSHGAQVTNRSYTKMRWFINSLTKKQPIKTANNNNTQSRKKFLEKTHYFA